MPPSRNAAKALPRRFGLRLLFTLIAVAALLLSLVTAAYRRIDKRDRQESIEYSLLMVTCAIDNYAEVHGRLPPATLRNAAGESLSSWRAALTPYLPIGVRWDPSSPWNAQINQTLATCAPCWFSLSYKSETDTSLFGISGCGAAFDQAKLVTRTELERDVILAMEVADFKTHWMQPGDYDVQKLLAATGRLGDTVKGLLPDRIHLLFADGEVWALSPDAPIDAVKPFLTISAARTADREKQLAPYRINDD